MVLKFDTSVVKGLKLKIRQFWGLIPTFVEVTGKKLVGGSFYSPIQHRVKNFVKFTKKHLCQSLLLNKAPVLRSADLLKMRHWHRRFPVNFAKFLRKFPVAASEYSTTLSNIEVKIAVLDNE